MSQIKPRDLIRFQFSSQAGSQCMIIAIIESIQDSQSVQKDLDDLWTSYWFTLLNAGK